MATITLHPSQVVAEESTYDSVSADAPLTKPIGKGATNATYAEIYLVRDRQAQTYVTYRFDTSSIPAGATIKKVKLRAKGDVAEENTYIISITRVSLLSGQDVLAESNDYAFGEMASTVAVTATNVTRAQLEDAKIKLFAQRGSGGNTDKLYFMRFYGADLIVEYEAGTTPPDPEPEPGPTPTDKTHAVLIDGTTYGVQGGRALVNGTAVDIKGGRALVDGTGVDILFADSANDYAPAFADNTWEQIIDACQRNAVPDTWVVGNSKKMTIGGIEYQIDIIGKEHDTYTDGGKAPLTFQLHDCHNGKKSMNSSNTNSGGWGDSAMRKTHLPEILAQMPSAVQRAVRAVNKRTSSGEKNSKIVTTEDTLFLLSEIEVFGSASYSFTGEGTQYDYYKSGNSKVKTLNGENTRWWERSPWRGNAENFCIVYLGDKNIVAASDGDTGVSFAFCF
nr:MAG TPA: hypothetical protein [Caudoviricetes sp.]